MAQRTETTVAKCFHTSCVYARFRIRSYTMSGQRHSQSTPTSLDPGCIACLGVTCHLHFCQKDRFWCLFVCVCVCVYVCVCVCGGGVTVVTRVGTDTEEESAHKVNSGEENSPAAPAGIPTRNLRTRVRRSCQQAILAVQIVTFCSCYLYQCLFVCLSVHTSRRSDLIQLCLVD